MIDQNDLAGGKDRTEQHQTITKLEMEKLTGRSAHAQKVQTDQSECNAKPGQTAHFSPQENHKHRNQRHIHDGDEAGFAGCCID